MKILDYSDKNKHLKMKVNLSNYNIMVVDDEKIICESIVAHFTEYSIKAYTNPCKALEELKNR